jgi:sugar phosphate permease
MAELASAKIDTTTTSKSVVWRWIVAATLSCIVMVGFFDRISIAVLFSNQEFGAAMGTGFNPVLMGMLMTAFLVPYALSALLLSFTGDLFPPRRLLVAAISLWGILMLIMGTVSSYAVMLGCRMLLGVAEGPQFSWIQKILRKWFSSAEYGRASTIWSLGIPLGSAIGFPLAIFIVAGYGWRASLYAIGFLNLIVVVPLVLTIVRDRPPERAIGAISAENRSSSVVWRDCKVFLGDWRFWALTASDCGALTYLWGLNSWLPTYLQNERHFDLQHLGFYSSLPFIMSVCGQIGAGITIDRTNRAGLLCFAGCFGAGALTYFGAIASDATTAAILIASSGAFFGAWVIAVYVLMQRIIPEPAFASGAGVINGIANSVGSLAPLSVGLVISATSSLNAGLLVIVIAPIVGACALLPLIRRY